ncbi:MAG TPA: hypothetical protein VIU65_03650 [Pyrinomonadaceae bacterium]
MKTKLHSLVTSVALSITFFLVALFASATVVRAQRNVATRDTSSTERTLGALENESRRTKRDAQTIMAEVNEDFERLRAINEEIKTAAAPATPFNFKSLSDNAVEIKKRGTRLRSNLAALPKAEKEDKPKEPVPTDDAQMRSLLGSLNTSMTSFLTNPVFSDMGTLDNQLALKARRDLEDVISLSDVLKSGAEKLSKRKS